jgi:DNA-directed RNA polymerase specialized sigma24 family protein
MMPNEQYLELEPMVNAVASQEWKRSPHFTIDDVAQSIWLHMMENWKDYDGKDDGLIRHMARRAARRYCQKQRTEYMYATGAFLYTPAMVRRYLEDVVWCGPEDCKDVEARVDISEAYKKLTAGQKKVIYKRYAMREQLANNAEEVAESRAIGKIADILNTGLRLQPNER